MPAISRPPTAARAPRGSSDVGRCRARARLITAILWRKDLVVDAGAPAGHRGHRLAGEDRGQGRGRGGVADAHVPRRQDIDPGRVACFRALSTPTRRACRASSRVRAGSWAMLREP